MNTVNICGRNRDEAFPAILTSFARSRAAVIVAFTTLLGCFLFASASAQTFVDYGTTPPAAGAYDISQLSTNGDVGSVETMNYYVDNSVPPGQTFTTGNNPGGYVLSGVYVKVGPAGTFSSGATSYTLRLYSVSGTTATLRNTFTSQNTPPTISSASIGHWLQFAGFVATNILNANTTYAYSLARSGSGWWHPSVASGSPYAGGEACLIPTAGGTITTGATHNYDATFLVNLTGPKLAVTSVNGGVNPTAGAAFSVVVQAQGANGTPVNVSANTAVTLSRTTGTGTLGGTLTGTILAGTSSVTISGVTYAKAETGVVLTATRTSGDTLTAGTSAAFTVNAGAATTLTLTSGNNQSGGVGMALASSLVVTATDAFGNPASGVGVTFAMATVPGGATGQSLSATSTTTAANGQASSILTLGNAPGTYTVTATSTGLTGSPATFTATAALKLVVTSVNGGVNPTAGAVFSVVVQAQGANGTPVNVSANTAVTLSRTTGTGTLGGTLTGTILAGTSSVTISGVTYTKAESGVVLTATRTSGDTLTAGTSATFTVNAGAATTLTLTSGNNQSGRKSTLLASPFVVTVTDGSGNPIGGIGVTFAIATVPAGATGQALSTTSMSTLANGQASSTLTFGNTVGTYTVTTTSAGLSGSPATFTATATSGNYTAITAATNEYQICFKCHTAYSWGATPPAGNSPNGTATSPVMTDVAQEFSPMNRSGHPIVTGLDNYPNSTAVGGKKGLLAAAMKAPWNVNVGQQTMMCSDCHDSTTTNYVASAAQGPHGSATQFMLRGPNGANWPTGTSFATSWCANCHNDTVTGGWDGGTHAAHHASGCYTCHIVIPHGGKVSRLLGANGGGLPARYSYNNSTANTRMTGITKSTASGYSQSTCGGCGEHNGGNEKW